MPKGKSRPNVSEGCAGVPGQLVARADRASAPRAADRVGARRGGRPAQAVGAPPPGVETTSGPGLARATRTLSPEEHLARAMAAPTPRGRGLWARRGLAARGSLDRTTQAMLLRQLYLAHFEQRRFDRAREVSQQALELGVLRDVVHQDAARACAALGEVDAAAGHLRLAARHGPPSRRAFHYWTLGSLFFNACRHEEAVGALSRAARWGTRDKPLYQAHLAIVQCASGAPVSGLSDLFDRLESAPSGQGYGRFVLGQLAFHQGRLEEARRLLRAFIDRTTTGRAATAIALDAELATAKRTLTAIEDTMG